MAGCLCAATELGLDVADALAKSILDRLSHHEARIARTQSWSFAHGWPGLYFALMQYAQAHWSGRPLPRRWPVGTTADGGGRG